MTVNEICPVCCEGHLIKSKTSTQLTVKSTEINVEQSGHACNVCGTEIATADDLRFNARVCREAQLQATGRMTGPAIKALRSKLHISHKLAGQLFGGGPVAFCKYENHEISPTDAMDNLLWIADMFPSVVSALAERHRIAIPNIQPTTPQIKLDMSALDEGIVPEYMANAAVRSTNGYKMWEHVPINMHQFQHASNEMTVNFESAIAA